MLTFEQKENNFKDLLARTAASKGCVFFGDSGEGRDLETDTLYCEDVSGWAYALCEH